MDAPSPELSCSVPGIASSPNLTIVFVTDGSELASNYIRDNIGWMAETRIPADRVCIAGPESAVIRIDEVSPTAIAVCSNDLPSCLSGMAKSSERVAIIGATTILNESVRPMLAQNIRNDEALSWFQPASNPVTIWARMVSIITRTIQRLILGTGKHELNCGGMVLPGKTLEQLHDMGIGCTTIDQLIAGCRTIGTQVTETRIGSPASKGPQVTVRSALREFSSASRFWWQQIAFPDSGDFLSPVQSKRQLNPWSARQTLVATSLLLAAALGVLFTSLGYPLFEPDETRNAQLALNILESGDWLALTLDNEHYWDKPPLQAWMTATAYSVFGASEIATRLPCAVCGFLTLVTVLSLGSRLFGFQTGLISASILLMCTGFVTIGRYVTMDASLILFSTLMGLATLLGVRDDHLRPRWLLLAGIACGLGMLTKGPVILVLALPPILLQGWLQGSTFWRKKAFWLWPGIPAFLITGPWFLATGIVHPDFLVYFFWKHNVVRFSDAFNHREPFWYYGPVLILLMYPACFLLPILAKSVLFGSRHERQEFGSSFPAILLAGLWPLIFFSISDAKLPTYILPAIPMLCLVLGRSVDLAIKHRSQSNSELQLAKIPERIATSSAIMMGVILVVCLFVFRSIEGWHVATLGLILAAVAPLLWFARSQNVRPAISWVGAIGVAVIFAATGAGFLLPGLAEYKSVHGDVATKSHEHGFEDSPILYYGVAADGSSFSLDPDEKPVSIDNDDYVLAAQFLTDHPKTILVTSGDNAKSLARNFAGVVELTPQPGQKKLYSARAVRLRENTARIPTNNKRLD